MGRWAAGHFLVIITGNQALKTKVKGQMLLKKNKKQKKIRKKVTDCIFVMQQLLPF